MIHSIVVAIDSTESSKRAQEYALDMGKAYHASVTGIAVLDEPWIKRPMAVPMGAGAYKVHRDETLIQQQTQEIQEKLDAFEKMGAASGVSCRRVGTTGSPDEKLAREAEQHDLVIIGRETNFHGHRGNDIGEATDKLLKDHPRPVIVIPPDEFDGGKDAVFCFDGSLPASRAMHMFYLLGLAKKRRVHVVSVDEDPEKAERLAARGAAFFSSRGVETMAHSIQTDDDSGEITHAIFEVIDAVDAGMVAMGAYANQSFLSRLLVGSVTRQMTRSCPVPLFVAY